jgi:hypothetical protein
MQVDRKVLEQALKALEQSETWVPDEGFGMLRREAERKHEATITALKTALEQPEQEPQFWEYDDGLTMNRRVYRHGKLMAVIPIEIIQDTPQMRPFRVAHSFGNREHRPTDKQENV